MFDLDLCNDYHQSVGTPPTFWFTYYVNGVSYLVGKPFIQLSSLSEKLCGLCWRSVKMLFCSVWWRILYSFLMMQDLQDQF
jgi:hypothetical protein